MLHVLEREATCIWCQINMLKDISKGNHGFRVMDVCLCKQRFYRAAYAAALLLSCVLFKHGVVVEYKKRKPQSGIRLIAGVLK